MSKQSDYYEILQVHITASKEVIDAAYRKLASTYHPDVNNSPEAADKMKLLNEAYEVLSDLVKRADYDYNRKTESPIKTPKRINWAKLIIPTVLIIVILTATRFGFRLALILLVFVGIIWVVQRIGRK